jgi:hypothetical protein
MSESRTTFGGLSLETPSGWINKSDILGQSDMPFTLSKSETGIGALQFSPAIYKSGKCPHFSTVQLSNLLREFAAKKHLGDAFDFVSADEPIKLAAATFSWDEYNVRVWYCSDSFNLVLITYTWLAKLSSEELSECEAIVRSLRFITTEPNG